MRSFLDKLLLPILGLVAITFLTVPIATADSTLHIGAGAGTACAMGCAGEPNLVGSGNVIDIFQTSGGSPDILVQP
jgi:hypothetical protein